MTAQTPPNPPAARDRSPANDLVLTSSTSALSSALVSGMCGICVETEGGSFCSMVWLIFCGVLEEDMMAMRACGWVE